MTETKIAPRFRRSAPTSGVTGEGRSAWRSWWAPAGDPSWALPAVLTVAAVAAVVYAWGINRVPLHDYYLPAVRSMSLSWRAWLYGGYDTSASITLDKLPGAFMLQALSVRAFGFHTWSVILPQVVAAVLAVLVLYRVVRAWHGPTAGVLAAAFLAGTPIVAALARSQISDGILVLLLVLAAAAGQRAVQTGRLWPLLACGVLVGLAFQTKMVQAWGVVPALAVVYLVCAPPRFLVRLGHLALAGVVLVTVSLWQVILFALTPADSRPYADGTSNNSLLSMIFEYNLSTRFGAQGDNAVGGPGGRMIGGPGPSGSGPSGPVSGGPVPGGPASAVPGSAGPGGPGGLGDGSFNWHYMLGEQIAPQVGWLYPLAVIGLAVGLVGWRSRRRGGLGRTDPVRAGYLLWGLWLAVHVAAFSTGAVVHSFYVVAVAPAIAALAAGCLVTLWRLHRRGSRWRWLLPAALAAEAVWTVVLSRRFPAFQGWLVPVAGALVVVAVVLLVVSALAGGRPAHRRSARWTARGGMALAIVGVSLAPATWAAATVDPAYAGSAIGPAAGPGGDRGPGGFQYRAAGPASGGPGGQQSGPPPGPAPSGGPGIVRVGGPPPGARLGNGTEVSASTRDLLAYLNAQRRGEQYLVAGSRSAGPLIVAGADALPMGGFSGQVPFPTSGRLAELVARHQVRFVLLDGDGPAGGSDNPMTQLSAWVTGHCAEASYQPSDGQTLYDCAAS